MLACAASSAIAAELTLTPSIDDITTSTTNSFTATNYTNGFVAPAVNVGNGGTWTWTTTFTLTETVMVDSIDVQFFTFNGSGATQFADRKGAYTFTISGGALESPFTSGSQAVTYDGSGGGTTSGKAVSYVPTNLSLDAGEYTLTLAVDRGTETNGYFVGLGSASISTSVPEPATATLSLLALAGLAARRRRK